MFREMKGIWSSEQIASGLRLAESGVPMVEVTRMMGVSPEVFSTWKAEYAELFDKLIIRLSGPRHPNDATKATHGRRIAYLSGSVGGEDVERELRECKLPYSVIENPAAVAGELLRSGSILGNFQEPLSRECLPSDSQPLLEASSEPTASGRLSDSVRRLSDKQAREADSSQMGQAQRDPLVLVSAQMVKPKRSSSQYWVSRSETVLSGVCNGEINELRWRMELVGGGQIDMSIIEGVSLRFSLDGILDSPIDAIRAFYTSPVDALLMGNLLIRKSDSPTRRA